MTTRWRWGRALLCALSVVITSTSAADPLADEFAAQLAQAQKGDVQAMYEVGQRYELGMGTATSRAEAQKWYRAAANQGHAAAAYQMGYANYWGKGVARDRAQAHTWFERAANAGNQAAMTYLSKMYALGQGVPQDKQKAAEWADRARTANRQHSPPPVPRQVQATSPPAPSPEPPAAAEAPAPPPAPVEAPKAAPVVRTPPPPQPVAETPRKPRPRGPTAASRQTDLLSGVWLKTGRPALYLPSTETTCETDERLVRCRSAIKRSSLLGRPYEFQIVSEISGLSANGEFTVAYRPEVATILPPPPGGYGDDVDETLDDEQLRQRVERDPEVLDCRFVKRGDITCTDARDRESTFQSAP